MSVISRKSLKTGVLLLAVFLAGFLFRSGLAAWADARLELAGARPVLRAGVLYGIWVCDVEPNSSAQNGGLRVGDHIFRAQKNPTVDDRVWGDLVEERAPNYPIQAGYRRWGDSFESVMFHQWEFSRSGARQRQDTKERCAFGEASYVNSTEGFTGIHGLLIQAVPSGSPAEEAGIRPGDVVIRANGKPLTHTASLRYMVEADPVGTTFALDIVRKVEEGEEWISESLLVTSVSSLNAPPW